MIDPRQWIANNPPLAYAIIAILGAIIGGFFNGVIWPIFRNSLSGIWDKLLSYAAGKKYEHRYLDWVIRQHRYLPTLPTTLVPVTAGRHQQELEKLYVSLNLAASTGDQEMQVADLFRENAKLIILGDPGAGKTTLLRFLAVTFARARRKRPGSAGPNEQMQSHALIKAARLRVKEEFLLEKSPLPVFVYLNRLRNITEWPKGFSLLDAVREELRVVDILRDLPKDFFESKLDKGECIFLFDAFDELGTFEARQAVARAIGELATSVHYKNQFIVTSRIVGYNGQLGEHGFKIVQIQHLTWVLIQQLVKLWYHFLNESQLGDNLLTTLRLNARIYELAVNPMLLSLIVLVQFVKRLIPDRRHILYDECVKILVERRYAAPEVQDYYNKMVPGDDAIRILQKIALHMHEARLREIPRDKLELTILPGILQNMTKSRAAQREPTEILRNLEERSQLIIERGLSKAGQPLMAFSHLTFQEFLASVALREATSIRGEALVSQTLLDAYERDGEWWEEVALLYAAQLDGEQQNIFFRRLYPNTSQASGGPP